MCINLLKFKYLYSRVFPPKALAKLKKIPDTIKAIMERLEPELKQIVKRSTTQIADHAYQRGENLAQESQPRYSGEKLRKKLGGIVMSYQGCCLRVYIFLRGVVKDHLKNS